MAEDKKTIEESLEKVEKIISSLQGNDLTLDESFKKYEEGLKLIEFCKNEIDKVEKKLVIEDGDAPFADSSDDSYEDFSDLPFS